MRSRSEHRRDGLRAALLLLLVASALAGAGCGDGSPPIGRVSGTVTHKGEPIPNLMINFMPAEGRPSWGLTDEDGRYTLNWDADHDGAEVDTHKVFVAYVPTSMAEEEARTKTVAKGRGARKAAAPPKDVLGFVLDKYGYEKSPLSFEVEDGSQEIDLALD